MNENAKRCLDCAFCSMLYPSLAEFCDKKDAPIADVYAKYDCNDFVQVEEDAE